nr:hypothetical protein [Tanacetum cinerariifolium]
MSRDVLTVGSTMRIPLLYRGEYLQWVERFMNYLEEQTDGEAMINSIKNGDQPLPRVTQVSIAETSSNELPPLKDKSMWHMLGFEYGEQDRKAAILYEYETFKATEGELLLDTYIRYLQVIKDLKKCGYSKDNFVVSSDSKGSGAYDFSELKKIIALLAKAFNRRKFYSKPTNNNLRTSSTTQSANKKQVFVKSDDKKVKKKDDEKKRDMSKAKCYNCKKKGHFSKDCKKAKVKNYNYYKRKMLLAKKDSDEQVLLAEDQAWMEFSSDSNQEINANMVFMAQIEKEDLVSYLKYFHDTFESSDDSTNVVNAPREPFVVKQDHGVKSSQNPPPIDECCCECGNVLDGIFCQQCTWNIEDKTLVAKCGHPVNGPYCQGCALLRERLKEDLVSYFQNFHDTFESSDDSTNVVNAPREPFVVIQDHDKQEEKRIEEEQAAKARYWKIPACCDDDDDYDSVITPILSTEEPLTL